MGPCSLYRSISIAAQNHGLPVLIQVKAQAQSSPPWMFLKVLDPGLSPQSSHPKFLPSVDNLILGFPRGITTRYHPLPFEPYLACALHYYLYLTLCTLTLFLNDLVPSPHFLF